MAILISILCIIAIPLASFLYFKYLEKKHTFNFTNTKKPKKNLLDEPSLPNNKLLRNNEQSKPLYGNNKKSQNTGTNVLALTPHPNKRRARVFLPEQQPPHFIIRLACKEDRQLSGAQLLQSFRQHKLIQQEGIYVRRRNGNNWFYVMNSENPPILPNNPKEIGEFRTSALMIFYSIPVKGEQQNRVWRDILHFCRLLSEDLNLELRDEVNNIMSTNKINQYGHIINHFFPDGDTR